MPTFDTDVFLERYPEFKEVDYEKIDLFYRMQKWK